MTIDDVGKQAFITTILERDLKNIYNAQLLIATKNVYMRGSDNHLVKRKGPTMSGSGNLVNSLRNPDYAIQVNSSRIVVTNTISKQLRFLDMKAHGNWQIYNRQVWGILYHNSLLDIKNNVGEAVHDVIGEILKNFGKV